MGKNEDLLQKALDVDMTTALGPAVRPLLVLRSLEVIDWNRSKVRLARLANGAHFNDLDDYYRNVQALLVYMEGVTSLHTGEGIEIQRLAQKCKDSSDKAKQKSQTILGTA